MLKKYSNNKPHKFKKVLSTKSPTCTHSIKLLTVDYWITLCNPLYRLHLHSAGKASPLTRVGLCVYHAVCSLNVKPQYLRLLRDQLYLSRSPLYNFHFKVDVSLWDYKAFKKLASSLCPVQLRSLRDSSSNRYCMLSGNPLILSVTAYKRLLILDSSFS